MSEKRFFIKWVGLSTVIHAAVLMVLPAQMLKIPPAPRTIEVAYQRTAAPAQAPDLEDLRRIAQKQPYLPQPPKTMVPLRDKVVSDVIKLDEKPRDRQDGPPQKTVSLPSIPGETFKMPEYKSYYQIIRERIRKTAYFYYTKLEQGEVFLTFVLNSDGTIKDVAVNPDKSTQSPYLTDLALRSVKEAGPYPEFPEKLKKNSELSFNVIIAFEFK